MLMAYALIFMILCHCDAPVFVFVLWGIGLIGALFSEV